MSWLSKVAGFAERLKLDVLMRFDVGTGQGVAGLRWSALQQPGPLSAEQITLVALLYARILVIHSETRTELFNRMARAARAVPQSGTFEFEPWSLQSGGKAFSIWPWKLTNPDEIAGSQTYAATLLRNRSGRFGVELKMALGLERILAPAAPLLAAYGLAATLHDPDRSVLAAVLLGINQYYQAPEKIRFGSEAAALAGAMSFVASLAGPSEVQG